MSDTTTTQEQSTVEALAEVMREFDWKQVGRQLTRDDYERAATAALLAIGYVDALRQPHARLTEVELSTVRQASNILFNLEQAGGPGSSLDPRQRECCKEVREKLDRLTAAPGQQVKDFDEEVRERIDACRDEMREIIAEDLADGSFPFPREYQGPTTTPQVTREEIVKAATVLVEKIEEYADEYREGGGTTWRDGQTTHCSVCNHSWHPDTLANEQTHADDCPVVLAKNLRGLVKP